MNLLDLFVRIGVEDEASDKVSKIGGKIKSGLSSAGKAAAAGIGLVTAAAGAAVGGLMALESATEEYRIAQGKLNTAFEAANFSTESAKQTYQDFYEILGDTDTATEASQLLAKLARSEEDLSKWTEIAAGVSGTFGDSLPIEGLIEASNETAKVGKVTGVLADALNWAGINEDQFNARLAAAGSEAERNQLIMETLSETYDDASEAFYKNNATLVEARKNQALMDETLAKLGDTVSKIKNQLIGDFFPAISKIVNAFNDVINGVEGADKAFSEAVSDLIEVAVRKLPEFLNFGVQIITSILGGIVQALPTLVAQIPIIIQELVYAIWEMLPAVADAGREILSMLGEGMRTGIPDMLAALPEVMNSFFDYITENLPYVLDTGVEMIQSFVDGIVEGLPLFLEQLPELITSFVDFISENLPKIVEAGVLIAISLADGMIKAIPEIVKRLPEIIEAIALGIVQLYGTISDIGVMLMGYIQDGIYSLMDAVIDWGKQIVNWFIEGIMDMWGPLIESGVNIVTGVWEGIKSAWTGFADWVTGSFSSLVDSVKGLLGIHSPSTVFKSIGQYMMEGLQIGLADSAGAVMETVNDIVDEVKTRFTALSDIFSTRQDISGLEYELWEKTEGKNATEAERYAKQLEYLNKQQQDQESVVEAAVSAYQAVVAQYGENTQESYDYQKTLLEEQIRLQDLQDEIYNTIAAMQELAAAESQTGNVDFASSGLGTATSATINATAAMADRDISAAFTANLVLPDGSKFATWQLPYLIKAGSAAGTPIAEAQRA